MNEARKSLETRRSSAFFSAPDHSSLVISLRNPENDDAGVCRRRLTKFLKLLFVLVIGLFCPIAANLIRPVSIALPRIQRRVDACTSSARRWCWRFRYPAAVLLPAIGIVGYWIVGGDHRVLCLRFLLSIRTESMVPLHVFAFGHWSAQLFRMSKC